MSRLFSISFVALIVAAAAVGLANPSGGIGGLLVDGIRRFVPASHSTRPAVAESIRACARDRGVDVDAVGKGGPREPDHLTTSTLAHCYLSLDTAQLCDKDTRISIIAAVDMYLSERTISLRHLRGREAYRANRPYASLDYDDRTAKADRQAEAYRGDSEIDDQLVQLARDGVFTPDDFADHFMGRSTSGEIKRILGSVVPIRRACEIRS